MSWTPIWDLSEPSGPIEKGTTYIVRPAIAPSKRPRISACISSGSRQLLFGPASSSVSRADEGAVLDAGDVGGVGPGEVGVRALGVGEAAERAGVDELLAEAVVLLGASRRTSRPRRAWSARRSRRPSRSGSRCRSVPRSRSHRSSRKFSSFSRAVDRKFSASWDRGVRRNEAAQTRRTQIVPQARLVAADPPQGTAVYPGSRTGIPLWTLRRTPLSGTGLAAAAHW